MSCITLEFSQICKVSPQDTVLIQYQESGSSIWTNLPIGAYRGKSSNYNAQGFNAASYPEWRADDSTVVPNQDWWKDELFDLSEDCQLGIFKFRFVIKKGQVPGTQASYGWLLENFKIVAASYPIYPPVVEFVTPFVRDSVGKTGPWEINAKVKTSTTAPIETPWLVYTTTYNNVTVVDSTPMTNIEGDSLWKASIPRYPIGTTVLYSITGRDTLGNQKSNTSGYIIKKGVSGEVIIGKGTDNNNLSPYYGVANRSWSRAIYYDWEFSPQKVGGRITSIAYYNNTDPTSSICSVDSLSIYVKATTNTTISSSNFEDPRTNGATLVWGQTSHSTYYGWNEFVFNTPFDLQPEEHLMVYWLDNDGTWQGNGYAYWSYTTQSVNNHARAYGDYGDFAAISSKSLDKMRPNIKVAIALFDIGDNSASLLSIDINDTVVVSPSSMIPILATVKNEGNLDLNSVKLSYSVNGVVAPDTNLTFNPSLSWDYIGQNKIGDYTPKVNGNDTIKVWISQPNGQNDPIKSDDTLTEIIYGRSDLIMEFVNPPAATVNNTGPFAISARIRSISGANIGTVSLKVDTNSGGTPTSFTLPMTFDAGAGLYRATIPHTLLGSDVSYSITLRDTLGNDVTIAKSFHINKPSNSNNNSVALVSIITPEAGGIIVGTPVPVRVVIRNKGRNNLTSCDIEFRLNRITQLTYNYMGGDLPEDFTDTITIDNYMAVLGRRDTIVVKVSLPNSVTDPVRNDDSIRVITLGCDGNLHGEINVGQGEAITTVTQALTAIRECGLVGDLTLKLKGTFNENVTIDGLTPYLRGYRLTITSDGEDFNNATIKTTGTTGVGITLRNTKNIVIKAITIDATTGRSGIQFTAACSNIVIRDCKISTNTTSTSNSSAPIYKANNTGIVDSIFVIHNILDGMYAGFFFYGGTMSAYGTNIVFDSNTTTNNYAYGMRVYYTDFLHISHNTLKSRNTGTARWDGLSLMNVNGDIVGNRIIQRNPSISTDGFYLESHNYYNTTKRALIANNELIYQVSSATGRGIYFNFVNADFLHNSFYMSSTGEINALHIEPTFSNLSIKNNNIVVKSATNGDLFKYTGSIAMNQYDIDYNNFYTTRPSIGSWNYMPIASVADLQQYFPMAQHIASIDPEYIDISENTDLTAGNMKLYSPILPIAQDIEGKSRTVQATMGAYQIVPSTLDLGINQILSWYSKVVKDQTVSVDIEVQNTGTSDIESVVFGWSLNGDIQPSIPWKPATPVSFFGKQNVAIGSFTVDSTSSYNIEVWIDSVNNTIDMYHLNDTSRVTATTISLVEWAEPFPGDSVFSLTFDVNARIRTMSGAPKSSPELKTETIINDHYTLYDTLPMSLNNGVWQVSVPQLYYGSMVIYSLTVSDTMNNTVTITDTIYIQYSELGKKDSVIIGTGTSTMLYNPYSPYYNYTYSRNYYMDYEINPKRTGGVITSIAFYNTTMGSSTCDNVFFYMKAVSDSSNTIQTYVDPSTDGATLVWGGMGNTLTAVQGWNVLTLQTPFVLPPNMNLLLYCDNKDGSWSNSNAPNWEYTSVTGKVFCNAEDAGSFPPSDYSGNLRTTERPNMKLTLQIASDPYNRTNLTVINMLNPVSNINDLCTPDYSPVQAIISNTGENDYDFTQNAVTASMEIIDPLGTLHTASLILNTGTLKSKELDTINLMSKLPIMYAGSYMIKVWISSPIDSMCYDDTLYYEFISGRIGLPIDVDFSAPTLPTRLVSTKIVGDKLWTPYTPNINDSVQPNPGNGTGVLRFDGTAGSMTLLSTRQIDLFGSDRPQLEFWYYHDTTLPLIDGSYMDVNAMVGGVSNNLAHLLHRSDSIQGWKYYNIPLIQFAGTPQCLLIQFEAMNKFNGNQYIDRIRITTKQDIAITGVLANYPACDLQNKEWKVILTNLTDLLLDYNSTPTGIMLEIAGTSQTFSKTLNIGFLSGSSSDTVTLSPTFDFTKGTYQVKAYLTTPLDDNSVNDTLITSIMINPDLEVSAEKLSGNNSNTFMAAEGDAYQTVTIHNTGNVEISNIAVLLQIDTDGVGFYTTVRDTITGTIAPQDSIVHEFVHPYQVPWSNDYQVRITAYLLCDSNMANHTTAIMERVDMVDLYIVDISNPSSATDTISAAINLTARIHNRGDIKDFLNTRITVLVKNSQGVQTASSTETIDIIKALDTKSYSFNSSYIVPNDSVYYLTVFIDSYEIYTFNDTLKITRYTSDSISDVPGIGIKPIEGTDMFTLSQNIPNPANNSTRIDYNIPEAGEVIFHVHSVSGQLLYSKTIEAAHGKQSLELNTNTFAAGIYFYSIEYKGQRLVKRMMIND
jgi:hypothetical protein